MDSYQNDVPSIGQTGILIVDPDADEEAIYQLTKSILENEEEARSIAAHRLSELGQDFAVEGLVDEYPVHPGAIRYYTIPLMKKSGYTKEEAGAIEASASTGSQIV